MADCECLPTCMFFNDQMKQMPITAAKYKRTYCKDDNRKCARYIVFKALGKESVPLDLFPNNIDRAIQIVSSASLCN